MSVSSSVRVVASRGYSNPFMIVLFNALHASSRRRWPDCTRSAHLVAFSRSACIMSFLLPSGARVTPRVFIPLDTGSCFIFTLLPSEFRMWRVWDGSICLYFHCPFSQVKSMRNQCVFRGSSAPPVALIAPSQWSTLPWAYFRTSVSVSPGYFAFVTCQYRRQMPFRQYGALCLRAVSIFVVRILLLVVC